MEDGVFTFETTAASSSLLGDVDVIYESVRDGEGRGGGEEVWMVHTVVEYF